jgi:hypothetical protein
MAANEVLKVRVEEVVAVQNDSMSCSRAHKSRSKLEKLSESNPRLKWYRPSPRPSL